MARSSARPLSVMSAGRQAGIHCQSTRKSSTQPSVPSPVDLVFDDAGEGACRGSEGHGDDGGLPLDRDSADKPEVDDVHAQIGVDDVRQRLAHGTDSLVGRICRDTGGQRDRARRRAARLAGADPVLAAPARPACCRMMYCR